MNFGIGAVILIIVSLIVMFVDVASQPSGRSISRGRALEKHDGLVTHRSSY